MEFSELLEKIHTFNKLIDFIEKLLNVNSGITGSDVIAYVGKRGE